MANNINLFNEQEIMNLIISLQTEKERHIQEKLAKKISCIKDERTAERVADLFYTEDVYIKNIAIEILINLEKNSLKILKEKLKDQDRNIRKFALDTLKYIVCEESCEIALVAIDDNNDNVVEAALEVISHQKYRDAEDKLLYILKKTKSVWIINALLRTFASLGIKHFTSDIEHKIVSLNATEIEKNILFNTYVKSIGDIGTYRDIETIISKYSNNSMIDSSNLISGLCNLFLKVDISKLSKETVKKLEEILKEHWNFRDPDQVLVVISTFVKLQIDSFLEDIEVIFNIYKGEDFIEENLYELIEKLEFIPDDFVYKTLKSKDRELVRLGLKLVHEKKIRINLSLIEELCNSSDSEISEYAISIISEISGASTEIIKEGEGQTVEKLLLTVENQSVKVRKAAVQKLVILAEKINIEVLEKIVKCNVSEEGLEALEVLFKIDENSGWKHINSRIDSINGNVRAGLIDIVKDSDNEALYSLMETMINDPSQIVRRKTIKSLNKRINDKSLSLLIELYEAESDSMNKMEIVSNLYKFNSDRAINLVDAASYSKDTLIKLAVIKALNFSENSMKKDILRRLLEDKVEEVQEAAKEALYKGVGN